MAVVTVEIASDVAISFAHSKYDTNAISSRRPRRMCIIGESCSRCKPVSRALPGSAATARAAAAVPIARRRSAGRLIVMIA